MTVTLTLPWAITIITLSMGWGVVIGAALMFDVMYERKHRVAPLRVPLSRLIDTRPLPWELSAFPGDGIVTHNELDQFARHYQGVTT